MIGILPGRFIIKGLAVVLYISHPQTTIDEGITHHTPAVAVSSFALPRSSSSFRFQFRRVSDQNERRRCLQANPADGAVYPSGSRRESQRDLCLRRRSNYHFYRSLHFSLQILDLYIIVFSSSHCFCLFVFLFVSIESNSNRYFISELYCYSFLFFFCRNSTSRSCSWLKPRRRRSAKSTSAKRSKLKFGRRCNLFTLHLLYFFLSSVD